MRMTDCQTIKKRFRNKTTVKTLKHIYFIFLLGMLPGVTACIDDEIAMTDETEEEYDGGDMINIIVTLDNMGGSIASRTTPSELTYLENYVDPKKLRVLFFDSDDKFLFESMSRWVKRLDPTSTNSTWSVSVPLYSYGNDKGDYDWEWDKIRKKLTSEQFKVAILANRPAYQYLPDLDQSEFDKYWFDNTGPNWTRRNSVVYEGNDGAVKDVFDLHHSQFDPIYYNKSIEPNGGGNAYDFIMADWEVGTTAVEGQPKLSSTSAWFQYDLAGNTPTDPRGWGYKKSRLPSEEEPIPMYGIQLFEPLTTWKKGTTIELNRDGDKAVSLLRSVVKLELLVPTGMGGDNGYDVVLFYGNWFARCEPMDVWTPTDQIWKENHGTMDGWNSEDCEWKNIWNFGPLVNANTLNNINGYQQRLSWIYGAWRAEKGWSFGTTINTYFDGQYKRGNTYSPQYAFPKIFNPCMQRLNRVYIDRTYSDGDYDHFVVYCGERNINDPTRLYEPANSGSGNSPVLYWTIITGEKEYNEESGLYEYKGALTGYGEPNSNGLRDNIYDESKCAHTYSLAMVDYAAGASVYNCTREGILVTARDTSDMHLKSWYPDNSPRSVGTSHSNGSNGTGMGEYIRRVAGHSNESAYYRSGDNTNLYSGKDIPLPLLRNHYYKITLGYGNGATSRSPLPSSSSSPFNFTVTSEVFATDDITVRTSALKP